MKPSLQLKLSQQLALTPQLQQAIKLLQLSTLEMNQEIERYLLENPLLEREDEPDRENAYIGGGDGGESAGRETPAVREDGGEERTELSSTELEEDRWSQDSGSYGNPGRDREDDEGDAQDLQAATTSLREHLTWQLGLSQFSDRDRALIRFLIEALDDDGYLSASLEELLATIPAEFEVEQDDLEIALRQLQSLDPTGVAARSPQECLALQLKALPQTPTRDLALQVVQAHLELLAARDFNKIKKACACDDAALKAAHTLIVSLDPRPGARFAALDTRYIIPDVIVKRLRGKWTAQINPDAYPKLRINRLYAEILSKQRRGEGGMSSQLQEARWLIKNVQQRFDTIARVSQAIVDRQRQFFEHGEVAMRPLVLREIADLIGLHESTVSRVTSQKYMATPRGIFELKYFFGSHVSTDTGGACSATAIRALIKQLISAEDGKKPLSDSQISEILGQQGIVVARRTVAKYREALNIPPVNLRKTL
ncbi:RNA polymerase factor sigma-54 [Azovibrio restrictus]|uniref:RNA polymerase factor sigma-54 n=1 Tax=Azovibrio restrictus TaxID=146938 RepID=UPI0026EA4C5B|nr:RNA polymerase factor sigma-54 [Azovibrio restrictus]